MRHMLFHPKKIGTHARCYGFTLLEVMVVAAIIAILAALVYPTYQHAIRKARRTEARVALFQLMQQQERYYSQHTTYVQFSADSIDTESSKFKWYSGDSPAVSAYEIQGDVCVGGTLRDCILITATASNRVGKKYSDSQCQVMSLSSTGTKLPADKECW